MVTLVMIVRNEEKTIADTLRSVLPAVDRVCIVDTGSEDRTPAIVADVLNEWEEAGDAMGDPLLWVQKFCRWVDYSTNRNQALELAEKEFGPGQWLLMLDADVRVEGVQLLRGYLNEAGQDPPVLDSFQLMAEFKGGGLHWPMHRIFRAGSGWRYEGVVHEVPAWKRSPEATPGPIVPGVKVIYQGTDAGKKEATWREHVRLLRAEIERKGGTRKAPRETFYLAQTHACLEEWEPAGDLYLQRYYTPGSYDAERWYAGLQAIYAHQMADDAVMRTANLSALANTLAWERPWRAEAWYRLAMVYGDRGEWDRCYAYACMAAALPVPLQSLDAFMIQGDVYRWESHVLVAVAAQQIDPEMGAAMARAVLYTIRDCLPEVEVVRLRQIAGRSAPYDQG